MAVRFVLPFADVGQGVFPAAGSTLTFTDSGTTNLRDTFADVNATIPNTNPVVANSVGVFPDIFIQGNYKVVLESGNTTQIYEADPVQSPFAGESSVTQLFDVATMVASDLANGDFIRTTAYFGSFLVDLETPLGGASYTIMTLAHFLNATTGLAAPDGIIDHQLDNGLVAMMDRGNGLHVTQGGIVGTAGNPTNGVDESVRLQGIFDALRTGDLLRLSGIDTIFTSQPLYLMSDTTWAGGFSNNDVSNVQIDMGDCRIKYTNTVEFSAIYPNIPIHNQVQSLAATTNRTPAMFQVSLSGFSLNRGFFDGNMQNRAAVVGNPVGITQEACVHLIGCKFPVVRDVDFNDSMGDGLLLGDAFTAGAVAGSAFSGANTLDALTEEGSVSNVSATRNAGSCVNVQSAVRCNFSDIHGLDLNSVSNFTSSLTGPVIKFEYDVARSFYNSVGFSQVQEHVAQGILAINCPTGGAFDVTQARNVIITDIVVKRGADTFGAGRIIGNLTIDTAKFCTAENINYSQLLDDGIQHPSESLFQMSGEANVIRNIYIAPNLNGGTVTHNTFNTLIDINDITLNSLVDGVRGDAIMASTSGRILNIGSTSHFELEIRHVRFKVISTSAGVESCIRIPAASQVFINDFHIEAPDSVSMFTSNNGNINLSGDGSVVTVRNSTFQFLGGSLARSFNGSDNTSTVKVSNTYCRGLNTFPSPNAFNDFRVDNVTVDAVNGEGGGGDILFIKMKSSQLLHITNCNVTADGAFGLSRPTNAMRISTDVADMVTLTNADFRLTNNVFLGGRASDSQMNISATQNGGGTTAPWTNTTVDSFFTSHGNVINRSNSFIANLTGPASAFQFNINASTSNFCIIPGTALIMTSLSQLGSTATWRWDMGLGGGPPNDNVIRILFGASVSNEVFSFSLL